jgi:phosphotransacetylase
VSAQGPIASGPGKLQVQPLPPVAGDADILLVPDLVSGNILAKNLEYLGGAVAGQQGLEGR